MADLSPYAQPVGRVPVRLAEVALRGGPTRYWVYGENSAPHRMVFLHGLRGDHHGLEPIVAHLTGACVVVPDLPGFGQSARLRIGAHDVAGYTAWARDLVAAVAPGGDAVVAGHSFGSIVAAAVAHGTSVRGLVLVNPIAASPLAGPRVAMTRLATLYHRLAAVLPVGAGTALLRSRLATRVASAAMVTTSDRALRRWIHQEHDRRFGLFAERRVVLEAFAASIAHDVGEYAGDVATPTLLVAGEHDEIAPLPAQRVLAGRFVDARLVVVPGTGHLAHYEAPAAVAGAIAGFLAAMPVP